MPSSAGLHRVLWGMTRVEPRSQQEQEEWQRQEQELAGEEEFFDYYDTVEYFSPGEVEVDRLGRSLQTRVHQPPGLTERAVRYLRVPPGRYQVVMTLGGITLQRSVEIRADDEFDRGWH